MSSTTTDLQPQEHRDLIGAADRFRDWLQVQVSPTQLQALERDDRARVIALCKKLLRETDAAQVPSPDQRAAAEAFAAGVERLPSSGAQVKREQELLAAYVRIIGFVPTDRERLVFRGVSKDATLHSLSGQLAEAAPEWRGLRDAFWASLDDGEAEELEELVEKALGDGGYFKRRRGERASGLQIGLLARRAEDGSPQRSLLPEGWTPLSPGLLDDVHSGKLQPLDLAVLTTLVLTLQSRRVHPGREHAVHFEGDTLVVGDLGRSLLPDWDRGARDMYGRVISPAFAQIVGRLNQRGWLNVEKSGNELRVRAGDRLTASEAANL